MPNGNCSPQQEQNIHDMMHLEAKALDNRTRAQKIADKVTTFASSTPFLLFHILWFGGWITINLGLIPGMPIIDKFPFSFLSLIVSLEAIFLSLLVLMSQTRMQKDADHRAHLDLQINILAEQESTLTLRMLRKICTHLKLDIEDEKDAHLEQPTDVRQLAESLQEKMPN